LGKIKESSLPSAGEREYKNFALNERGIKARTLRDILAAVRKLCKFTKIEEIHHLTTAAIRSFLHHGREEKMWKPRTYRLYWQYIKGFFDWCVKSQYIKENPVISIEKPRLEKTLPRCLSHEDALRILYHSGKCSWYSAFECTRNETIVATFLMSGIRRGELLALESTDVDLQAEEIFIRQGKGSKDRIVPIHDKLLPILRKYIAEKKQLKKESIWFFPSSKSDKQLTPRDIYRICKRISKKAQVKFTPHMLRHTFGRELVEADLNLYKLMHIMGHESVTTTQIYVSLSHQSIKKSFNMANFY